MTTIWQGVLPAITTPFDEKLAIDHAFVTKHVRWLISNGCKGIIPCGSLGESATLSFEEKVALIKTCVAATEGKVPVIPGIAALSTDEAVRLAKAAEAAGCGGLMVLPPYVYSSDWREMKAHVAAVIGATKLPCMLYNNPPAYKTDFVAEQVAELAAEFPNLQAVKESSGDSRRVTALVALLGDRVRVGIGLDDMVCEGVAAGAEFWVAGTVNALPKESIAQFELAKAGRWDEARALYRWHLPLLRLDTVVKFVQLIKLLQEEVGMGNSRVRPPRLEVIGAEREYALGVIRTALKEREKLAA
ncbi:dihydrodipicolinate synthase family protein [Tahibacter amnicola]|uniref:Dihydrodipicolinate synthase family protein n=1 Tax=Tahibacter amnicola TaxID=2976241 RepID=A0ABY6BCC7_9GAMM|nr:dihydrodipicolinate synthase family protein [Tahibacter amnicola]UXI67231.1 dihydrodipicolinate synthase family protein [Tahibacter amnicola]